MPPLSICLLTYELPASLTEPAVSGEVKNPYNLARGLASAGHAVTVLSVPALTRTVSKARYRVGSSPPTFDIPEGRFLSLPRILGRIGNVQQFLSSHHFPFDIYHAHHPALAAAVLIAQRRSPPAHFAPVVTTGHGTAVPEADADGLVSVRQRLRIAGSRVLLPVDRWAFRRSAAVISVSDFQRAELSEVYRVDPNRVAVIYNGVDTSLYSPGAAPATVGGLPSDQGPIILFVGRLVPKKGVQYLIEAFPRILAASPKAHCVIVGGSPAFDTYGATLRTLVTKAGLDRHFTWLESVPESDLPGWYTRADVGVFPSEKYESIPTVIFEAMASDLPVVTTARWGSPEALGSDHPGLVPEGDPAALAEVVIALISDPRKREAMLVQQRARLPQFTLAQSVAHHEKLYRDVIAGRPAS